MDTITCTTGSNKIERQDHLRCQKCKKYYRHRLREDEN